MSKKLIGLKLADGTFYPILKDGTPEKKHLKLTASSDNQASMKIELFKASDDSFSDAEYMQTLVLDQMIPQKKENHLIDFIIDLDENNVLTADLNDAKSGISKSASIPLPVSGSDDFVNEAPAFDASDDLPEFGDIGESVPASAEAADAVVADFLSQPVSEETAEPVNVVDEPGTEEALPDFGDFDILEESAADNVITDGPVMEDALPDSDDLNTFEEPVNDDVIIEEPAGETDTGLPVFDDLGETEPIADSAEDALPDFGDFETNEATGDGADSVVEDFLATPIADDTSDSVRSVDETVKESLPDFDDFNTTPESPNDEPVDKSLPDFGDFDIPEESVVDNVITNEPVREDELPDFGDFNTPEKSVNDDVITEEPAGETNTGLPVFDDLGENEPVADTTESALPDFGDFGTSESVTDGELPDFGDFEADEHTGDGTDSVVEEADLPSFDDVGFAAATASSFSDSSDSVSASDDFSPENFDIDLQLDSDDDLYSLDLDDDADSFGTGSDDIRSGEDTYTQSQGITDFDFLDKKTRLPFVPLLCIICAVVSLLCLLGMFFIFLNGKSKNTIPVQPTALEQQNKISVYSSSSEPEKPVQAAVARDNVIVVLDSPVVVPSVPEKIVTAADEKKYKVKWGDTLWDIAESYYKDPWMYKKIAALNNIKNPDFILSGTWIVLPPK